MKAFLGFVQFGLGVAGIVALINGQWLPMIGAWVAGGLVGLVGNRLVRMTEGVSQSGQDAIGDVRRTSDLLRRGAYPAAVGTTRSLVSAFRSGGDRVLLPFALTLHSVALAAVRDHVGAQRALTEATQLLRFMPAEFSGDVAEMREMHAAIQRELDWGVPDPSRLVASFLDWNDTY